MRNRSVANSPALTFQALADSTRLGVLDLLRQEPRSVGEIVAAFPISRPAISRHLRQLHKASLVLPTRRGRHRVFQVNPEPLRAVDTWLDQYRVFWGQNLSNLKSFVEERYARETGAALIGNPGTYPKKARNKNK